ncbi:lysozyme-like [Ylistrum balloti]|uniref:lysozyme-like n=1 Tax=Ylistrum balloti TaxID=509963 RepID=UPI00290594B1|nr:lysozyme-like [Ylistrum balloti]
MWLTLLSCLTLAGVASSSISGHIDCVCLKANDVHARTGAGLSHSIVATLNSDECYNFNGKILTKDGYHWYELDNVHGHYNVWVAGTYLRVFPSSYCSGNSTGRTTRETYATGLVSQHCLDCICQHESGCRPLGCAWDENSDSCGYFQLKDVYWQDCGKPGGSLAGCAADLNCSSTCVQKYMTRYIRYSGCAHNCESYARIHNGGPRGCKHSNTLRYWSDVEKLGCSADS